MRSEGFETNLQSSESRNYTPVVYIKVRLRSLHRFWLDHLSQPRRGRPRKGVLPTGTMAQKVTFKTTAEVSEMISRFNDEPLQPSRITAGTMAVQSEFHLVKLQQKRNNQTLRMVSESAKEPFLAPNNPVSLLCRESFFTNIKRRPITQIRWYYTGYGSHAQVR